MMQALPIPLLLLWLLAAPAFAAEPAPRADELDLDRIVQTHPDMPPRGTRMETVREALGPPRETVDSVGDPPISRWIYDDFTVFFEHDRVLHSVTPRRAGD